MRDILAYLRSHSKLGMGHTLAVASALTILIALAAFLTVLDGFEERAEPRLTAFVILSSTATGPDIQTLRADLASWPGVASVVVRDGAANLAMLRDEVGHPLSNIESAMLPTTLQLMFQSPLTDLGTSRRALADLALRPNIEAVEMTRPEVTGLLETVGSLQWMVLLMSLIVVFVGVFIVANIQGTSILVRREEIEILRLVGATDRHIIWPLYRESLTLGLTGSVVATLVAAAGAWWLGDSLLSASGSSLSLWASPIVVIVGVLMTWIGTTICLRRYAHLVEDM